MDDDFDPEQLRPVPYEPDTEVTLGWATLLGITVCLLALCGICFWQGYSMGRNSVHASPPIGQAQGTKLPTSSTSSASKPSAGPQGASQRKSAMNSQSSSSGVSASSVSGTVTASTGIAPMVQVAAVSRQEDADVLIGALRKRGYTVSVHRDPADGLLHVRVGPFANRNDANATRQKLLNEGYNASVLP